MKLLAKIVQFSMKKKGLTFLKGQRPELETRKISKKLWISVYSPQNLENYDLFLLRHVLTYNFYISPEIKIERWKNVKL